MTLTVAFSILFGFLILTAGSLALKKKISKKDPEPLSEAEFLALSPMMHSHTISGPPHYEDLGTEYRPRFFAPLTQENIEVASETDLVESLISYVFSNGRDENSKLIEEHLASNFDGMREYDKKEEANVVPIKKPTLTLIEGGKKDEVVNFVPEPA